jgi:hypothetical protein
VGWPGLPGQLNFLFYKYVKMTLFWSKFYKKKINGFFKKINKKNLTKKLNPYSFYYGFKIQPRE